MFAMACGSDVVGPTPVEPLNVDAANLTVNKDEFDISASASYEAASGIATDGVKALVAYTIDLVVVAQVISTTGTTSGTVNTGQEGFWVQAAYGNGAYLVVWMNLSDGSIWGQKVSTAGGALGNPFKITSTPSDADVWFIPAGLAFGGGKFLVTYTVLGTGKLKGRFVNPDKTLGSTITVAGSGWLSQGQNVASDGSNFLAVYAGCGTSSWGLCARRIGANGTMATAVTVVADYSDISQFGVAYSGGSYLVSYETQRSTSGYDIMARKVSTAGALAGGAFLVDGSSGDQLAFYTMKYGDGFLVIFINAPGNFSHSARGRRVATSGNVSASQTFFSKNTNTGKVPLPIGVAIGTKVFFAVNRTELAGDPLDIYNTGDVDVRGAVITP
jgi:hypothetical protein